MRKPSSITLICNGANTAYRFGSVRLDPAGLGPKRVNCEFTFELNRRVAHGTGWKQSGTRKCSELFRKSMQRCPLKPLSEWRTGIPCRLVLTS
jgi:hypothetical protein